MQMETHLVECKIDQSFDYLITAGGHSRREQQTHQQGTVSVRQANPKPSHIQAATSSSHLLQCRSPPPPPVMAAGRQRPGEWTEQHLHGGVLL